MVRDRIADGTYGPGERIPSETALAKSAGLSFLTVRQALKVLVDEGLLERYPGRGTFVSGLNWRRTPFGLAPADPAIERDEIACELLSSAVERAGPREAEILAVPAGSPLAAMRHRFRLPGKPPFMAEEGRLILDPFRPLVEAGLPASFLKGLFQGGAQGLLKSASLTVAPATLSEEQARVLAREPGLPAHKLSYLFFDAASRPVATGFYLAPEGILTLAAEFGLPLQASRREASGTSRGGASAFPAAAPPDGEDSPAAGVGGKDSLDA
jgi:GntR family transcriptional regulator